jgi:broad specificity polyphosphatase/5'/3'-nucleotidase SurE
MDSYTFFFGFKSLCICKELAKVWLAAPAHSHSGETLHITFLEGIVVGLVIEILEEYI